MRSVARNVRTAGGELDLVMRDGAVLVFVEVRVRGNARHGGALASVDAHKRARLRRAALGYLQTLGVPAPPCRFDVVCVQPQGIVWLRDAFRDD